nr:hypothetical protein [Tanacetum cinerariifolium]
MPLVFIIGCLIFLALKFLFLRFFWPLSNINKVITFEVLCQSLQIEPTVTLFRVFQALCKQGDWFSFAKRRARSHVCIDHNRSCMKHPKSGFFLIDRRAILDFMVWSIRMRPLMIQGPLLVLSVCLMASIERTCYTAKGYAEGVLVLSWLSHVWKSRVCDPVLRGADGNDMRAGIHLFLCLPEWTGSEVQEEPHHDIRPTLQRLLWKLKDGLNSFFREVFCLDEQNPRCLEDWENLDFQDFVVEDIHYQIVHQNSRKDGASLSLDDEKEEEITEEETIFFSFSLLGFLEMSRGSMTCSWNVNLASGTMA